MPPLRENGDLARAARLYFVDGLSQKEVADKMQTTRSNVSRMLTAARERGVVQIRILDSAGRDHDLEEQLMDQFGLSEALVARFEPGSHPARRPVSWARPGWSTSSGTDRRSPCPGGPRCRTWCGR